MYLVLIDKGCCLYNFLNTINFLYHTEHLLIGLFPVFSLQLNAFANSSKLDVGPLILIINTLYLINFVK